MGNAFFALKKYPEARKVGGHTRRGPFLHPCARMSIREGKRQEECVRVAESGRADVQLGHLWGECCLAVLIT